MKLNLFCRAAIGPSTKAARRGSQIKPRMSWQQALVLYVMLWNTTTKIQLRHSLRGRPAWLWRNRLPVGLQQLERKNIKEGNCSRAGIATLNLTNQLITASPDQLQIGFGPFAPFWNHVKVARRKKSVRNPKEKDIVELEKWGIMANMIWKPFMGSAKWILVYSI